jgi:hypothetical protein
MEYAAIALALLGFAIGALSRLSALVAVVVAVFILSVGFAIVHRLGLLNAVLLMVGAQTVVQGSYFLGLIARALMIDRRPRLLF